MQAAEAWKKLFTTEHLKEHYFEKIAMRSSVGLDKITPERFESEIDANVDIIFRKTNSCNYRFTRYKQLLFLKGAGKPPRSVSVPTIRDKLTLSVMNELLGEIYQDDCKTRLPQLIIREISESIKQYDSFIKLDIKSFYSSIDHSKLLSVLKCKIRKPEILHIIKNAIETESIAIPVKDKHDRTISKNGVPEGLPISNALANLFLLSVDNKYSKDPSIKYWRYVDDILILTNSSNVDTVEENIVRDLELLNLKINEKRDKGLISKGFEYLGYSISTFGISVRQSSVFKIEQSLENLFKSVDKENIPYYEWKINNKITGFILDEHKYGWLFFYSQISNIDILFHLDLLVNKFIERYELTGKIHCKRFVRTYHEMCQALHSTKYIPNFDKTDQKQKRGILVRIFGDRANRWDDEEIERKFHLIMSKEIRDIEKDIENFS